MTDRLTIDQITSNGLDRLYDRLDRAETELQQWAAADSAGAAAGSYAHRAEHAEAAIARVRKTAATRSFMAGPNAVDVVRVTDIHAALDEPTKD